uniref:Leptin B n=1 Tax=Scomber japonicus TaxID=13676 RepID=A0A0G3XSU7_SCOJP|nr:leptin B [Scomber japonicus]
MHILLALLCISVAAAPMCMSVPTKGASVRNTMHSITSIAQTTLVHIKKLRTELPVSPQMEVNTPSIEGLTSISHDLGLLDNELQNPFTELLSQIQADVSSLKGRVISLAKTIHCPPMGPTVAARPIGESSDNSFPDSYATQTLTKVQNYLEKFLLNKDKLKVC